MPKMLCFVATLLVQSAVQHTSVLVLLLAAALRARISTGRPLSCSPLFTLRAAVNASSESSSTKPEPLGRLSLPVMMNALWKPCVWKQHKHTGTTQSRQHEGQREWREGAALSGTRFFCC